MDADNVVRVRKDLNQFIWFALGYAVVLVLGYLLLREINIGLSPTEMGRYSYVTSFIGISSLVLSLSAPQAYLRFHDENRHSALLHRRLLPLFCIASIGMAVILWYNLQSPIAVLFAAQPFFDERVYAFRGQMRAVSANALKIVQIAIPLIGVALIARFAPVGTLTAAVVFGFYGVGYLAAFLFPLKFVESDAPDRSTLFKYLIPVMITMLAGALIYDLSVVVAKHLFGFEAAAKMGVAARSLIFIRALFTVFMMLYPVIYFREMKARRYGVIRVYRRFVVILALIVCVVMVAFASLLYRVTGAVEYLNSTNLFMILTGAAFCDFLFDVCGLYFQHQIKTWKNTLIKLISVALLIIGFSFVFMHRADSNYLEYLAFAVLIAAGTSSLIGVVWALVAEHKLMGE